MKTYQKTQLFLALAKKYTGFTELTTPMINEFVEKIIVHAPEKIDGERTMEIDIYLKFIGRFDVPIPEPTPEEIAAVEADKKRRSAQREKYLRKKARREQKKLEAQQAESGPQMDEIPAEETA